MRYIFLEEIINDKSYSYRTKKDSYLKLRVFYRKLDEVLDKNI